MTRLILAPPKNFFSPFFVQSISSKSAADTKVFQYVNESGETTDTSTRSASRPRTG
jgi:hypothetical protein